MVRFQEAGILGEIGNPVKENLGAVLKKVLSFKGFGKTAGTGARVANTEAVISLDDKDFKNV